DKAEIIRLVIALGTPLEYIWTCYHGYKEICGHCESCKRYLRARKLVFN
ncbi:MAG: 7-cyano-7-deazaguanine synthase, partial [Peptococcaceae bacterium]|nr:7-cyano-7-deazaguanine synthase [Peptococcaceae bacterium]